MGKEDLVTGNLNEKKLSTHSISDGYTYIMLLFGILYSLWSKLWEDEQETLVSGTNLISFIGLCIPLICFVFVYRRVAAKDKIFWLLILLGQLAYVSGELSWNYYELFLKVKVPYPGLPDFFYLLCPWFFIAALIYRTSLFKNKYISLCFALDILLVVIIISTLSMQYLIYPIYSEADASPLSIFVSVSYPISDMGLLFGAIYLWSRIDKSEIRIFTPMIGGIFLFLITDTYYLYLNSKEIYRSGGIADLLWVISLMLLGLSAIYQVELKTNENGENGQSDEVNTDERNSLLFAPYLLVIMLLIMFSTNYKLNAVTVGSVLGVLIIMIRQNVTLLDNKKLLLKLKQANEELVKVNFITEIDAKTDYLTGLYNRRCIEDAAEKLLDHSRKKSCDFSIVMIDIDYFKKVNDEFGHETGDFILKEISGILKNNMRAKELIGRYGGEEFIGLLPEVNLKEAKLVAERLRKEVARHDFIIDKKTINVTISLGISEYRNTEDQGLRSIVKRADNALYKAKSKGRNRTVAS